MSTPGHQAAHLSVPFDARVLADRVATERGRVVMNSISLGCTLLGLVGVLLYVWLGRDGDFGDVFRMLTWLLSVSAGVSLAILIARFLWLSRLRAAVRAVGEGLAFVVSRWGIECAEGRVPWAEVDRVAVSKGAWGHGHRLRVDRVDAPPFDFPLAGLGVLPGTLDSAMRAYSAGRHGVDLSILDD